MLPVLNRINFKTYEWINREGVANANKKIVIFIKVKYR